MFILISIAMGWLGNGYNGWVCAAVIITPALIFFLRSENKKELCLNSLIMSIFALIGGGTLWAMLIQFGSFNPYNDTFTYLCHGQWLQDHGFRTSVVEAGTATLKEPMNPWLTQIAFYQSDHLRMGSSFFLGFLQAASFAEWSYIVYPCFVAIPLLLSGWLLAGTIEVFSKIKRIYSLWFGALFCLLTNGISYGAIAGFPPQIYGLVFAMGSIVILEISLNDKNHSRLLSIFSGIFIAASIHCYSELTPFVGLTCLLITIRHLAFNRQRINPITKALVSAATGAALINFEAIRVFKALVIQAEAFVGWPIVWDVPTFFAHALGFYPGSKGESINLFGNVAFLNLIFLGILFVIFLIGFKSTLSKKALVTELNWSIIFFLAPIVAFFVYFRWFVESPWDVGSGQTWNQFKLTQWASWAMSLIFFRGLAEMILKKGKAKILALSFLGAASVWVIVNQSRISEQSSIPVLEQTSSKKNPFLTYQTLLNAVKGNYDEKAVIYLNLGGVNHKSRQMISYFLKDYTLVSNWTDDVYIGYLLPLKIRNFDRHDADFYISLTDSNLYDQEKSNNIPWEISDNYSASLQIDSIHGPYNIERNKADWWIWTDKHLEIETTIFLADKNTSDLYLTFDYVSTVSDFDLRVEVTNLDSGKTYYNKTLNLNQNGQTVLPKISITDQEVRLKLRFSSENSAVKVSIQDPRKLLYMIKNLKPIEASPEKLKALATNTLYSPDNSLQKIQTNLKLHSIESPYNLETSLSDWWYWTNKDLIFEFTIPQSELSKTDTVFAFEYTSSKQDLIVDVIVVDISTGQVHYKGKVEMKKSGSTQLPKLNTISQESRLRVVFSSGQKAGKFSDEDPRELLFMIKNFRLKTQ
jgi:hypothetical protein